MKVKLLAYTELKGALTPSSPIHQGQSTLQENLIEYAGRVCYRSDAKMGKNPGFISLRVREGHEDIIEHVRFVFQVEGLTLNRDVLLLANQPTVEYSELGEDKWVFSLNARNIRDYWRQSQSELAHEFVQLASAVAPLVYADIVKASPAEEASA